VCKQIELRHPLTAEPMEFQSEFDP
jgi:hypothetical protein